MAHGAPWVQSYGDCELIRDLYAGCVIDKETWRYGSTNAGRGGQGVKDGDELVIRPPGSPPVAVLDRLRAERRLSAVSDRRLARERRERLLW